MRRVQLAILFLGSIGASACNGDDAGQTASETNNETNNETSATESETSAESGTETGPDDNGTETETGEPDCYADMHAIVTDIDETLTTADSEFLMQLMDSTYDPLERGEAAELINDYHARGYYIVYLTARAESQFSIDDAMIPARDLTEAWLVDHGFPMDENTQLILAPGFVVGDATAMYKGQALLDLEAEGYTFDYAYGNALTDIDGYEMANIPKDVTFIIGVEAGMDGTVPIAEEDYVTHRAAQIPTVPNYCEG